MKHITEFLVKKKIEIKYTLPKNKNELINLLTDRLRENDTDFNDIDVSKITDMSDVFSKVRINVDNIINKSQNNQSFKNVDISDWDVRNVKSTEGMFRGCKDFNCDISNWKLNSIENMLSMFAGAEQFSRDLEQWNIPDYVNMDFMFYRTELANKHKLPSWYVGKD